MRIALVRIGGHVAQSAVPTRADSWYSRVMLIAAFLWITFALFAGSWLSSTILSMLRRSSVQVLQNRD
jgi:hypothetical protein